MIDITRKTFDPKKRYSAVVAQQGRVLIDADLNELQDIHEEKVETALTDVIGPDGAPKRGPNSGFAIAVASGGTDLSLSAGHYYVGGRLCVTAATTYKIQPWEKPALPTPANGLYVAYIDTWERPVTALDDPNLIEPALGGPDTTGREQVIWKVRLASLAAGTTCENLGSAWKPNPGSGLLAAKVPDDNPNTSLCSLGPRGGYQLMENHLYRVQVHTAGNLNTAVFKWSRDNGCVAGALTSAPGVNVTVADLGPDSALRIQGGIVEPVDRWTETGAPVHPLCSVQSSNGSQLTLSPAAQYDQNAEPKLRRWDGTFQDSNKGVDGYVVLEGGLAVKLSGSDFKVGDYWLIPARAATDSQIGHLMWPGGAVPTSVLPHGVEHRYAALGIVNVTNGLFTGPTMDCRELFPAITDIRAVDVSYQTGPCQMGGAKNVQEAIDFLCDRHETTCTVVIEQGDDAVQKIMNVPPGTDMEICFGVGTFNLATTIAPEGQNKAHLKICGCGRATKIIIDNREMAIMLNNYLSVTVRDISTESRFAKSVGGPNPNNGGVLTLFNCKEALIEAVHIVTGEGAVRSVSAINSYRSTLVPDYLATEHILRIYGCTLEVGNAQIGIQVVNGGEVRIDNNVIRNTTRPILPLANRLLDNMYRSRLRARIMGHLGNIENAGDSVTTESLNIGGIQLWFTTAENLKGTWGKVIQDQQIPEMTQVYSAVKWLKKRVDSYMLDPTLRATYLQLNNWFNVLQQENQSVMSQGIVIAGRSAPVVEIHKNTIHWSQMGIHIGVSHSPQNSDQQDWIGDVRIESNTIRTYLKRDAIGQRHGIFVGNVVGLLIHNNRLQLNRTNGAAHYIAHGIRTFGYLGDFLLISQNRVDFYNIGMRINPQSQRTDLQLWEVRNNFVATCGKRLQLSGGVQQFDNVIP